MLNRLIKLCIGCFLIIFLVACGEESSKEVSQKITFVDTASGANFQLFFKETVIPKAEKELGIEIDYVVSSEPEMRERIKAWGENKDGDIHLVFLKPQGFYGMKQSDIQFAKLTEENVPNMAKIDPKYREKTQGIELEGEAATFWHTASGLLYNSDRIPNPPKSWQEFYDRREEFKGHIGVIRPDAKSAGGREFIYTFLNVNGADFSLPVDELIKSEGWKKAVDTYEDFNQYFYDPMASEPPVLFQQFKSEEVWITEYAIDYTLWSRDKGLLPDTIKATFLEEGNTEGGGFIMVIPDKISDDKKALSYLALDYFISDEIQTDLVTQMWQYPGTMIEDQLPEEVWDNIPKWEEAEAAQLKISNSEAMDYIKVNGMNLDEE
ncbi:extracellular solute-binding protein [Vallitalea okinawensis]|uniref:extracellular solute-binding protein n=1 Tax=Vallitalea okinawensis TaxID=2078660 RepID=UPI000CFB1E51|nr:ABC transporter substrate-binding protein [Vallitalea okinawensis]